MAYYTYRAGIDSVTITVYGVSFGQRLRFFLRRSASTATDQDFVLEASSDPFETTLYGLSSNTDYTVNVGLVLSGYIDLVGTYLGPQTFTTGGGGSGPGPGPSNPRPEDWRWWSAVYSGGLIQISANEWNAFCSRINAFRQYRGLSDAHFTFVFSGTPISAGIVNEARAAIWEMNYYVPDPVWPGDPVYASFFLGLQNALNAIN